MFLIRIGLYLLVPHKAHVGYMSGDIIGLTKHPLFTASVIIIIIKFII